MCFSTLMYSLLLTSAYSKALDCIEGETWYELCKKCNCLGNGKYTCIPHLESCSLGSCIENIVLFDSKTRCHCAKNKTSVCVPLTYQPDLHGKPCTGAYYYYDNCTYCTCDKRSNKTKCEPIDNCELTSGGLCNDGEEIMEKCHSCSCTYSKFRTCKLLEDCYNRTEKPGKCYSIERFYSKRLQNYCISQLDQQCYSDYGCPGQKKCCQIVDCYLRCVDPVF